MTPIFFPFTYLPRPVWEGLRYCFEQIRVLIPSRVELPESMNEMEASGFLDIVEPVRGDEKAYQRLLETYRQWADSHQGIDLSQFKIDGGKAPFFDESATHRIRTDILHGPDQTPSEGQDESLMAARTFLSLAQAYDVQYWEYHEALSRVDRLEKNMVHHIRGEGEGDESEKDPFLTDTGHYMTGERLRAWTRLLEAAYQSGQVRQPTVLVTSSLPALEHFLENFPRARQIQSMNLRMQTSRAKGVASGFKEDFARFLEDLSDLAKTGGEIPSPPLPSGVGDGLLMALEFFLIPDFSPREVFRPAPAAGLRTGDSESDPSNLIVAILRVDSPH